MDEEALNTNAEQAAVFWNQEMRHVGTYKNWCAVFVDGLIIHEAKRWSDDKIVTLIVIRSIISSFKKITKTFCAETDRQSSS